MKKVLVILTALLIATLSLAGEKDHATRQNASFERLKPLVGTWETEVNGAKIRTTYSLAAHGSALMEVLMPESEAMVNMIHPDGDAVMMTHYCAGANQPRYRAAKFDGNSIDFTFIDGTNLGATYMNGVKLTLVDENHMIQEWSNKGESGHNMKFEFTRVK